MMNDAEFDSILKKMAAEHRAELPSPGLIWFRAQIARKTRAKERVERPLVVMGVLTGLVCVVLFAVFAAGNWGQIRDVMGQQSWFLLAVLLLALAAAVASGAILLRLPAKR